MIAASLCLIASAYPQRVSVTSAAFTGAQYLGLSKETQGLYTAGLVDGLLAAPLFERSAEWMGDCIEARGMTRTRVAEIIRGDVAGRPGEQGTGISVLAYNALRDACKSSTRTSP